MSPSDQAFLSAYVQALVLTQPAHVHTPSERVCEVWSAE